MATDISTLIVKVTSDGAKQTEAELKNLGNQADKTANQTNKLEKGTKQVNSGFKAMKGSTQQVSYQLQDIAVQSSDGHRCLHYSWSTRPPISFYLWPRRRCLRCNDSFRSNDWRHFGQSIRRR